MPPELRPLENTDYIIRRGWRRRLPELVVIIRAVGPGPVVWICGGAYEVCCVDSDRGYQANARWLNGVGTGVRATGSRGQCDLGEAVGQAWTLKFENGLPRTNSLSVGPWIEARFPPKVF